MEADTSGRLVDYYPLPPLSELVKGNRPPDKELRHEIQVT